jgi:hypothetical protein
VKDVPSTLAALASFDRPTLASHWTQTFGLAAPKSCQATLLRQALAWRAQMEALIEAAGPQEAERASRSLRQASASAVVSLTPGTRLLREWQGRTHHVTVVAGGFEYEGRVWRSLSAIARSITGTRWSGPSFFGLTR